MSVSPADFELYSRVTGSPLPRSPQEQMRMAPHVYNFIRHNQYAQTKREPSTLQKAAGFLGKAALVGAGLGALYGASDAFGRDPEASTTSVPSTSNTGGEAIDLNYEPEYQSQGDAINISSTPQINISPGYESQYEPQGDLIAVSQNEVLTQQGADIPAASLQGNPRQYVVGSYPLAASQTEYPPNKYFSPRGDYNDPENIIFGLPTNEAGRTQLSKFINTLHIPQINEELIDDNSQLVDHPDLPGGEVPHTPQSQAIEDRLVEQAINETTFDSPYLTQTYNPDDDSIGQIKNKYTEVGLTHGGDIYTRFRDHGNTAAAPYFTRTHPQEAEAFEDFYRRGDLTGDDGINPSLLVDALLERTIARMGGKDKQYKMGPEGWE